MFADFRIQRWINCYDNRGNYLPFDLRIEFEAFLSGELLVTVYDLNMAPIGNGWTQKDPVDHPFNMTYTNIKQVEGDNSQNCPSEMGLRINGTKVKVTGCKTELLFRGFVRVYSERCTMNLKGDQRFDWFPDDPDLAAFTKGSSFAVRVKQWIYLDYDYQLETLNPFVMDSSAIDITYPTSSRPLYVLLPLRINFFDRVNLRDNDPKCFLDLFIGMPPGKVSDGLDRKLRHDKMITENLESSLYNILIPPKCSPHLVADNETNSSHEPLALSGCGDGSILINTQAFRSRFDKMFADFKIERWIQCYNNSVSFAINVRIEFATFLSGKLDAKALDLNSNLIEDQG
ncbi:unnamed protein product, partial [Mesorhabditis belari]|uniref:Uncharacterized protein n=1 Tax=Mesorhabditis belari TaxID=2138241 RepID=A0AAF3EPB1_9BILA